jgi:CBS domain-containing protein
MAENRRPDPLVPGRKDRGLDAWGMGPVHGASSQGRGWWQGEPLTAADVMTANVSTAPRHLPLIQLAELMRRESVGVVPIVGADDALVGIVTDRDIVVRGCVDPRPLSQLTAEDVMTSDIECARVDDTLVRVVEHMGKRKVRRLPVLEAHHRRGTAKVVGIVSIDDVRAHALDDLDLAAALERLADRNRRRASLPRTTPPPERTSFFPALWRRLRG